MKTGYCPPDKPNRLATVADGVGATPAIPDDLEGSINYTYYADGNLQTDSEGGTKTINWNVYDKVASVSLPGFKSLAFGYDGQGQRITKSYFNGSTSKLQWYVRDAQGNIMAIYDRSNNAEKLLNVYLYGSARVGEVLLNRDSAAAGPWNRHHYRIKGNRHYELNNHLGNVLAVVSSSALNDPARYRFGMNGQEQETETNANL